MRGAGTNRHEKILEDCKQFKVREIPQLGSGWCGDVCVQSGSGEPGKEASVWCGEPGNEASVCGVGSLGTRLVCVVCGAWERG